MFSSPWFLISAVLAFAALATIITFEVMEMNLYLMFQ